MVKLRCVFLFNIVEVKSSSDGFMIKMRDGRQMRCARNNPEAGNLNEYAPHPAMVLKLEDGTGLLFPVIVCMFIITIFYLRFRIYIF